MPVKQLETPCWKPCAPGQTPQHEGPHWSTEALAAEQADPGDTVLPFPAPCWVAVCDGLPGEPCGEELENVDDGWTVHEGNPADLGNVATAEGWEAGPDGTMRCSQCRDEALGESA